MYLAHAGRRTNHFLQPVQLVLLIPVANLPLVSMMTGTKFAAGVNDIGGK
jgi:hypothetical protein